jgi:hypothetical protein
MNEIAGELAPRRFSAVKRNIKIISSVTPISSDPRGAA